jgi:hypothetical protein
MSIAKAFEEKRMKIKRKKKDKPKLAKLAAG